MTSRSIIPRTTSFARPHGIGKVVVTLSALRMLKTSVNSNSTPAWTATPKQTLNRLRPITVYHSGLPPLLDTCTPPVLVGRADPPCDFTPTARLGITVSKSINSIDGANQNMVRIPRVPITSTLRGECERTRVLHVYVLSVCFTKVIAWDKYHIEE